MSEKEVFDADEALNQEIMRMSTDDLVTRTRLLDNEVKIMRSEQVRIKHEIQTMNDKIKENRDKVKVNKTLPYLVSNVIELLDVEGDDQEEDGANVDLDAQVKDISYRGVRYGSWHGLVAIYRIKPLTNRSGFVNRVISITNATRPCHEPCRTIPWSDSVDV